MTTYNTPRTIADVPPTRSDVTPVRPLDVAFIGIVRSVAKVADEFLYGRDPGRMSASAAAVSFCAAAASSASLR